MAESVDALVSNTSAFTGMPVRLRLWVQTKASLGAFVIFEHGFRLHFAFQICR